jgi:hypothetical protein
MKALPVPLDWMAYFAPAIEPLFDTAPVAR